MKHVANAWAPFIRRAPGKLMMIQRVSYEGCGASWLGFGHGPEAIGAFAKVDLPTLEWHTAGDPDGPDWPAFRSRHRRRGGPPLDELDDEELQAAFRPEPDALVARLLYDQICKDTEGSFSQLVTLDDGHFVGMDDRAAWFAPVLAKKSKLFQVCACNGWFSASSVFVRAKSRAEVMHQIVHAPSLASLRARLVQVLTRHNIRTAKPLPSTAEALEPVLTKLTPNALRAALDFAYAKGDTICCFSVVEAAVPVALEGAAG